MRNEGRDTEIPRDYGRRLIAMTACYMRCLGKEKRRSRIRERCLLDMK